jgi:hypothetical protein
VTDEESWALIGVLDGAADETSVARLVARLGDRAEDFRQRLDQAVQGLRGARFHMLPVATCRTRTTSLPCR